MTQYPNRQPQGETVSRVRVQHGRRGLDASLDPSPHASEGQVSASWVPRPILGQYELFKHTKICTAVVELHTN